MTPQQLVTAFVALILMNFTAVIAGVIFLIKKIIWLAKLEFRIEVLEGDVNALHEKNRELKSEIRDFKKGA